MKSILRIIVFVPLGLIILFFEMANRGSVRIGFDPFASPDGSASSVEVPIFLVVMVSMAIGVLAGGLSTWLAHFSVRRAARLARSEAKKTRIEIEKLRQQALTSVPADVPTKGARR